ncbi:DUF3427 domain-containing protein [Solirubrum puertoriconensis]|uniref:Restriction endonuclease subunit R n=1 Tax=Solirubrum puertoriconensis TaxID=1751427 RepID=A0A9X0HNA4_SOLP1|nr:DUF3427 domain-containing protein [Solirubrum puertoriconensis]KUG09114.1 restriction endonuclease subunit R [Solirubrum puertoriconensis]
MTAVLSGELLAGLQRGFMDAGLPASEAFLPQLLINHQAHGKTVLAALHKHLAECEEFWFSVAFATKGGVATLLHLLQELERRRIKGRVLVSQYQNFTQPEALRALLQFSNLELRIATQGNFHAKGYLFKKRGTYDVCIGSSNLTDSALRSNKEWNLQVSATPASELLQTVLATFEDEFTQAVPVTEDFLTAYEQIYHAQFKLAARLRAQVSLETTAAVKPNAMQREALHNLAALRVKGEQRALLISATATGKTYLSAFDAQACGAKRVLFVVHRNNIAQTARRTFQQVFGHSRSTGMYSGNRREAEADFVFSTVQTVAQENHLRQFAPNHFDYIVIDETHRSGAESYRRLLDYFRPKFLLGMTATPERTDGYDVFQHFDHNIAYEIRLQRALAEDMLAPFHYFGVTDVTVDGEVVNEAAAFNQLVAVERVEHILTKARFYGCDDGQVRGLVFCRNVEESRAISAAFNARGLRSVALDGSSSETLRAEAISRLESDVLAERIDYIFTVDIFNEGIDIPRVNQVIMLRPTQSAIVFVQQLGRGLRKAEGKEHLTVIDFIGNYQNNYLVPIALFGDTTYNKDTLRKLMVGGSSMLPGASTINFDQIAQQRIFAAIDRATLDGKKELVQDYKLLRFKLGRIPTMVDFLEHGARDPFMYVTRAGSYFNFVAGLEPSMQGQLSPTECRLLELISTFIANAKRIEEVLLLELLLPGNPVKLEDLNLALSLQFNRQASVATLTSCLRNLNFAFIRQTTPVVEEADGVISLVPSFAAMVSKAIFGEYLRDVLAFARARYSGYAAQSPYVDGFFLYQKYSRQDVCRILNWDQDESSTVYGYKVKHGSCPIFVNYHKEEDITDSTKYEEGFADHREFHWMSKSNRKLTSPEIVAMQNHAATNLRLPLFIKKSNGEGADFYYMGEVSPVSFEQSSLAKGNGETVPVVKVVFYLAQPVADAMFTYLTSSEHSLGLANA